MNADNDKPLFDRVKDKIDKIEKDRNVGDHSNIDHKGLGTEKGGGFEKGGANDKALDQGQ